VTQRQEFLILWTLFSRANSSSFFYFKIYRKKIYPKSAGHTHLQPAALMKERKKESTEALKHDTCSYGKSERYRKVSLLISTSSSFAVTTFSMLAAGTSVMTCSTRNTSWTAPLCTLHSRLASRKRKRSDDVFLGW